MAQRIHRKAILEAHEAGAGPAEIARRVGCSRMQFYRFSAGCALIRCCLSLEVYMFQLRSSGPNGDMLE
ncbi:helix-turn-helix domain-containing protein [Shinella sp.]|jgi:hypothetical protein|uniref:helix-turn-helix domain-containing protein n=1 Tax=Shinella sp. TaxID=1870904 RepID=UPI003F6EE9A5